MTGNQLLDIDRLEKSLWESADHLRANSNLSSSEYCMPALGIIFLRHAANRYEAALAAIKADQAAGKISSATRKGWSERSESCDEFMKSGTSSSGCETRPAKGEAAPAGSESRDGHGNAVGGA
jgi:type I restriction-modification system DNA methylase subunit